MLNVCVPRPGTNYLRFDPLVPTLGLPKRRVIDCTSEPTTQSTND